MKFLRIISAVLMMAGTSTVFTGCATHDPDDSSIPWNRPAQWEDRPPGMGF